MDLEDVRFAVSLTFLIFWLWRFRNADDRFVQYVVIMISIRLAFAALFRFRTFLRERQALRYMRGLDLAEQDRLIDRSWLSVTRQFYREAREADGTPEKEGNVERFPFGRSDRRHNRIAFWVLVPVVLAIYVVAFALGSLPRGLAWGLWVAATLLMLVLAWLRARDRHLCTVLEVSPFALTEIAEDGSRRTVQWSQPIWVRNRPRLGRVELGVGGHPEYIALDYSRLGIIRIVDLVAEYAGLKDKAPSDEPKARSSGQDH